MCFINVLFKIITNLKFYKCCKIWTKVKCKQSPPQKKIHRLGPMDLKIYSLEKRPQT
jgi:hypothetical protein